MIDDAATYICSADEVINRGKGVRFTIDMGGKPQPAFVIRFDGKVYGFINFCPHLGTELDWQPGEFFDFSGLYLVCATHGALFVPDSGYCAAGPCKGRQLARVSVVEQDGKIFLTEGFSQHVE